MGDPALRHHLAFRDHLTKALELAREYEGEKIQRAMLHPQGNPSYADCKDAGIKRV